MADPNPDWRATPMMANQHLLGIGKIVMNLQALEFVLRMFVGETSGENVAFPKDGDTVAKLSHLTNRDSLGTLVDKFNRRLTLTEAIDFKVDQEVVAIRDSLAHGRLSSQATSFPLTLWRFGKPIGGDVPIEKMDLLTEDWLDEKKKVVFLQIDKVTKCGTSRKLKSFLSQ